ncbi:MAG: lipopolysaccharide biosynthesis protein [Ramlibacter sp.]
MMSLEKNIFANYAGQIFIGIVGIAVVPIYLPLMGAEAYGLIGFFILMQAWSQLLDLGMSATVSRETAKHVGGATSALTLRQVLRCFELIFLALGSLLSLAFVVFAEFIARHWLDISALAVSEVGYSVALMGVTIAVRWGSGLYRGVLMGLERQVWLNVFTSIIAGIRFIGVIPVLLIFEPSPICFFVFQVAVSVLELLVLITATYTSVFVPADIVIRPLWRLMRPLTQFSASIAFATVVWILVTQADKLIISSAIPLADFGLFTATVMLAGAISMLSAAISQALLPQLTRLTQLGHESSLQTLYSHTTQWTAAIAGPMALCFAAFAEPVLWSWTGNNAFAAKYGPVLALYAIGNGFMTLAAFPYYLQFARGDIRLHIWGNGLFAAVLLPTVWLAATRFGAIGAGWVWAISNATYFFCWTPWVHHQLTPRFHWKWIKNDIALVLLPPSVIGAAAKVIQPESMSRVGSAFFLATVSILMFFGAIITSSSLRAMACRYWRRLSGHAES